MRILYLAHRIPFPPDKGDKMRAYRHLLHLCQHHEVWCACFIDAPDDEQHVETLRSMCRDVGAVRLNRRRALMRGAVRMARGGTITEAFYDHPRMHDLLNAWKREQPFDVVAAFSSSMAPYALKIPAHRRVLDLCDLDSAKWWDYAAHATGPIRFAYQIEGRRLALRERAWAEQFDATMVITEAEAADLRAIAPSASVFVVTNGMDPPDEAAHHTVESSAMKVGRSPVRPVIGFVGVMDYLPNVDAVCTFVESCWPGIRTRFPTARFRIVGRRPTRAVRRLRRTPGVEVVGAVDDVAAELRTFDVSVAPLRLARGLQNKVLEAMAHGVPVVLSRVAARGIRAVDNRDYLVAEEAGDFVRLVNRLLADPDLRQRIGSSGRRFVSERHNWSAALRQFELIVTGGVHRERQIAENVEVNMAPSFRTRGALISAPE